MGFPAVIADRRERPVSCRFTRHRIARIGASLRKVNLSVAARLVLAGAVTGCFLPMSPGCTPEESLPRGDAPFLYVGLRSDRGLASVGIDRTGRSQFRGEYTVWMLATPGSCRTLPEDDVRRLEETWRRLSETSPPVAERLPERPFLRVSYYPARSAPNLSPDCTFDLRPGSTDQSAELEEAAKLTLSILTRTFGDRFVQEIRAAGLEALVSGTS